MFWRRKATSRQPSSAAANPFDGLRSQALAATPKLAGWNPGPTGRRVFGAVLDWGLDRGLATVFALDDGTASLYLSSGGGVIGGGFHASVRLAALAFIASYEPFLDSMEIDPDGEVPPPGNTDLRALSLDGRRFARAATDVLGNGRHPMSAVFHAGQALIGELRATAERGR